MVVGTGVSGQWAFSLARKQVLELETEPIRILLHVGAERAAAIALLIGGLRLNFGEKIRLDILQAQPRLLANTDLDANNDSVVVWLSYGRFSLLLTGDVQQEGEGALLTSGQPLDSLVLKVPHHGADTSHTLPFLRTVSPGLDTGHARQPTSTYRQCLEQRFSRFGVEQMEAIHIEHYVQFLTRGRRRAGIHPSDETGGVHH